MNNTLLILYVISMSNDSNHEVITVSTQIYPPPQNFRQFCDQLIGAYFQGATHTRTNTFGPSTTELYTFDGSNIEISFNGKKNALHVRTRADLLDRIRTDQQPRAGFHLTERTELCQFHLHALYTQFTHSAGVTVQNTPPDAANSGSRPNESASPETPAPKKKMLRIGSSIEVELGYLPKPEVVDEFVRAADNGFVRTEINFFQDTISFTYSLPGYQEPLLYVQIVESRDITLTVRSECSWDLPITKEPIREFFNSRAPTPNARANQEQTTISIVLTEAESRADIQDFASMVIGDLFGFYQEDYIEPESDGTFEDEFVSDDSDDEIVVSYNAKSRTFSFTGPKKLFNEEHFTEELIREQLQEETAMVESINFKQATPPAGQTVLEPASGKGTLTYGQRLEVNLSRFPTQDDLTAFAKSISPQLTLDSDHSSFGALKRLAFILSTPLDTLFLRTQDNLGQPVLEIENLMHRPITVSKESAREFFEARFKERDAKPVERTTLEINLKRMPTMEDLHYLRETFFPSARDYTTESNAIRFPVDFGDDEIRLELDIPRRIIKLTAYPDTIRRKSNFDSETIARTINLDSTVRFQLGKSANLGTAVDTLQKKFFPTLTKLGSDTVEDEQKGPVEIICFGTKGSTIPYTLRVFVYRNTGETAIIGPSKYIKPIKQETALAFDLKYKASNPPSPSSRPQDRREEWEAEAERFPNKDIILNEIVTLNHLTAFAYAFLKDFNPGGMVSKPVGPSFKQGAIEVISGETILRYFTRRGVKLMISTDLPSQSQIRREQLPENAKRIVLRCNDYKFLEYIHSRKEQFLAELPVLLERIRANDPSLKLKQPQRNPRTHGNRQRRRY